MALSQTMPAGGYADHASLTHRQRKQVYMSSSLFAEEGPSTRSIYAPERQQFVYDHLPKHQKPSAAFMHGLDLPPPADVRQTQNHGHDAVLGKALPVGTPEDIRLIHAHPDTSIPQEYWKTDVNLTWSDPRNELNREKHLKQEAPQTAGDRKAHELSSELFSHKRMEYTSTNHPQVEIKSSSEHFLGVDSSAHDTPNAVGEKASQNAHERFLHNLTDSKESFYGLAVPEPVPQPSYQESNRRRSEKNYSDLFGVNMGERKEVKKRQEATATMSCGWLDARAEIAERNKNPHPTDIPEKAFDKKEKELSSHVLPSDYERGPTRYEDSAEYKQVEGRERVCWDTPSLMTQHSEIARRTQDKDFGRPQSAHDRKLSELSSAVIGDQTHGARGTHHGYQSTHQYEQVYIDESNRTILTVAQPGSPLQGHPTAQTARARKLASLQGSLVFEEG